MFMRDDLPEEIPLPDGQAPIDPTPYAVDAGARRASSPEGQLDFCRRLEQELPFLRRVVRRWHRNQANADDLVQDTLVQALANHHLWQPGSNLRAWLYTIMRNEFVAAVARSNRSSAALARIAMAEIGPASNPAETRLVMRDTERVLRRLPESQRSAVLSVGIDGKSYEEAARLMETTVAALRCHLARARNRLRSAVDGGPDASPLAGGSRHGSSAILSPGSSR